MKDQFVVIDNGNRFTFVKPEINLGNGYSDYVLSEVNGEPSPFCFNINSGIVRGSVDKPQCYPVTVQRMLIEDARMAKHIEAVIAAL